MTPALVVVASRQIPPKIRNASNARTAPSALLAWAGGPGWVRVEYPRRPPIDNLEGTGHHLEARGRRAGEFTVRLHADRRIAGDLDAAGLVEFNLRQLAVGPPIEHRQAADSQPAAHIPNCHHVDPAVVRLGFRSDPHRSAQVGAVRDGDRADTPLQHRALVQPKTHGRIAMPQKADHRGSQEIHGPTQDARPAGRTPHDLGTDPGIGDVDEEAASRRGGKAPGVEGTPAIRRKPGGHILGPPWTGNAAAQVGAGAALQESDSRRSGRRAPEQAIDDFMGRAVAAARDYQPIAGRGGIVGHVAPPPGLDDLEAQIGAGCRTPPPEAAGSTAARCRVDDYEWSRIRRAFSTSRAICCCNAGTLANRFSARNRCTNQTVISWSYRSPSKSRTKASTVSVFPPKVGRKPMLVAPP